jgi:hypothetical protein
MYIKKKKLTCFLLFVICAGVTGSTKLYSQYILDEEKKIEEKKEIKKEQKKVTLEKKQEPIEKKKETLEKKKVAPEIKKEETIQKKPLTIVQDTVDSILQRTFFKGLFREAVKELQNIVVHSDNKRDISKARLFTARSYIEMFEYKKALDILISNDVKEYFPKDAVFWEEFVLTRIKNY